MGATTPASKPPEAVRTKARRLRPASGSRLERASAGEVSVASRGCVVCTDVGALGASVACSCAACAVAGNLHSGASRESERSDAGGLTSTLLAPQDDWPGRVLADLAADRDRRTHRRYAAVVGSGDDQENPLRRRRHPDEGIFWLGLDIRMKFAVAA